MPSKVCLVCSKDFWSRWRNTPAVCESCVLNAVICPCCWAVTVTSDPSQLSLFDAGEQCRLIDVRAWERPIEALVRSRLPRGFDYETYIPQLLANIPARHVELENIPPWPRWTRQRERRQQPFF